MSRPWYLNPYLNVFLTAVLGTAAEVFQKMGATATADMPAAYPWLGITGLASIWTWACIVLTITALLTWTQTIRFMPLGVAFTLSNMVHVLVPLSSHFLLNEAIDLRRWLGIALVVMGLVVVAKPSAKVEERL